MRKMNCVLLVMVFFAMIVAVDYAEVHAWSEATVGFDGSGGVVATVCKGCDGCIDRRVYQPGVTNLSCVTDTNSNGSWVRADVTASPPFSAMVVDSLNIHDSDWGQGKLFGKLFLITYDSIKVSMSIPDPNFIFTIQGKLRINFDHPNLWSRFEVKVYDVNDDPDDPPIYYGWAIMVGEPAGGYALRGNVPGTVTHEGDFWIATFDHDVNLTYEGDLENLRVWVKTFGSVNLGPSYAPALTQWGLIILVALLIASAVFVMLRRRKATVPA